MWSKRGPKEAIRGHFKKRGEKVNLLEDLKASEAPGRRGGDCLYAQAIYSNFDEIVKLKADGFTLMTICKFLEKKGALPKDSDPHSFRRAFRREGTRRLRVTSKEVNVNDTTKKDMKVKENIPKIESSDVSVKQKSEASVIPAKPRNSKPKPSINPDYTFDMAQIDPDDLPDLQ